MDRLEREGYRRIYPTHFGPVDDVSDHIGRYREVIRESSEFVRELVEAGTGDGEVRKGYLEFCRERAERDGVSERVWQLYEAANPTWMCADGIGLYWRKKLEGENG